MGKIKSSMVRIGKWIRAIAPTIAIPAGAIIVLMVIAGVYLSGSPPVTEMVALVDHPFEANDLSAAEKLLDSKDIAHQSIGGRLYVGADIAQEVRAMLVRQELIPTETTSSFEQFALQSDLWQSETQNSKRWQIAKMAVLSRSIRRFDSVRSAMVILEPGTPRTLGVAEVRPTAAVNVSLKDDARMTTRLIGAIADLISGSVPGMNPQDIRIVDDSGCSYRVADDSSKNLYELREAEAHYTEKIQTALHYIDNVIVGVNVSPGEDKSLSVTASVAVPRSYLLAVHRTGHPNSGQIGDEELQAIAETQLAKIQQAAMRLIGTPNPDEVKVDWYYDVQGQEPAPTESSISGDVLGESGAPNESWAVLGYVFASLGAILLAGAALTIRLIRARGSAAEMLQQRSPAESIEIENQQVPEDVEADQSESSNPFAFLTALESQQIASIIRNERAQIIALILSSLPTPQAAAVLELLSETHQVQIARHLADPSPLDEQVMQKVVQGLAATVRTLARGDAGSSKSARKITDILNHVGYRTERTVLRALRSTEPVLAEAIGSRMFTFEDIAQLSVGELRGALESIDSDELAVALRTGGTEVRKKIFSSLSSGAARQVRREMEQIGPVRLSRVEAAQQHVVEVIRQVRTARYMPRTNIAVKERFL